VALAWSVWGCCEAILLHPACLGLVQSVNAAEAVAMWNPRFLVRATKTSTKFRSVSPRWSTFFRFTGVAPWKVESTRAHPERGRASTYPCVCQVGSIAPRKSSRSHSQRRWTFTATCIGAVSDFGSAKRLPFAYRVVDSCSLPITCVHL
jgi:hypothetical protein